MNNDEKITYELHNEYDCFNEIFTGLITFRVTF